MMERLTARLMQVLAVIGGAAILLLVLQVGIDVVTQNLANRPLPGSQLIVTYYYMIALAFIPVAWVEYKGGMVAVELIDHVASPRQSALIAHFVDLVSALIYGALAWFTLRAAIKSYLVGSYEIVSEVYIPLWPSYFLPPIGFAMAALVCALRLFKPKTEATT